MLIVIIKEYRSCDKVVRDDCIIKNEISTNGEAHHHIHHKHEICNSFDKWYKPIVKERRDVHIHVHMLLTMMGIVCIVLRRVVIPMGKYDSNDIGGRRCCCKDIDDQNIKPIGRASYKI